MHNLLAKGYRSRDYYEQNDDIRRVLDLIQSGFFSPERPDLFKHIVENLLSNDTYLLLADFEAYAKAQKEVEKLYLDQKSWAEKAILNTARMGKFSSDRTIEQYAKALCVAQAFPIKLIDFSSTALF